MSLFCPKCWAKARCLDSRCDPRSNSVRRRHECLDAACLHRFTTMELIVGGVDLRQGPGAKLLELAWGIFDQLGGDQAEERFLDAWRSRRSDNPPPPAERQWRRARKIGAIVEPQEAL